MNLSMMGVINPDSEGGFANQLTAQRTSASIPFAGRYRLIDFVLSNMVNSDIQDVAVFTKDKYRSLTDHLGRGAEWDLDRRQGGLFILPPAPASASGGQFYGDLDNFLAHQDYFFRGPEPHVLIAGAQAVCNIDYREVLRTHYKTGANITVVYRELTTEESDLFDGCRRLALNKEKRVVKMESRPGELAELDGAAISLNTYLIEKSLLLQLLAEVSESGGRNLAEDMIARNLKRLDVRGFPYEGYLAVIDSTYHYYRHSMDLLRPEKFLDLFSADRNIYTKVMNEPPAKYDAHSRVQNTLMANGCVIEGEVEGSILFRGVRVHRDAKIRNSILMQRCEVGEGACLENVILDKEVFVRPHRHFQGAFSAPLFVGKRLVV